MTVSYGSESCGLRGTGEFSPKDPLHSVPNASRVSASGTKARSRGSRAQFGSLRFRGEAAVIAATALLVGTILTGAAAIVLAAAVGAAIQPQRRGQAGTDAALAAGDQRRVLTAR